MQQRPTPDQIAAEELVVLLVEQVADVDPHPEAAEPAVGGQIDHLVGGHRPLVQPGTPVEALDLARDNAMNARTGTCAVMYVTPEPSYHSIHKWIAKLVGKY